MPKQAGQLTERQAELVEVLRETRRTPDEIADQLGCTTGNVYRLLAMPAVQEEVARLTRETLGLGALTASKTLVHLTRNSKSERVQLEAAKAIIDRSGIITSETGKSSLAIQINLNSSGE